MTSGGENGMSGWPWAQAGKGWGAALLVAAVGSVVATVNATSDLMEARRDGERLVVWAPFLWEFSSVAVLAALAPLVAHALRALPPRRDNIVRFVLVHAGLTLPFSLVHVTAMVAIRKLGYWFAGSSYDFGHGLIPLMFLYEWRKDVLSYAVIALVLYYVFQRRAEADASVKDERIELRDGGGATFLAPSEVLLVEAAGNYVEFHTAAKTHLVRGTLSSWEARLIQRGFVRVHRSRLVNRTRISAIKPTPAGDAELTLDDGRMVVASRRYREGFETARAQ